MLPGGFKKDSRIWLHKNSRKHRFTEGVCNVANYRQVNTTTRTVVFEDDTYSNSPPIVDFEGRVYKKDSRSWLHKSSSRKSLRKSTPDAMKVSLTAVKFARRMMAAHNIRNMGIKENSDKVFRGRSSTEVEKKATKNKKQFTDEECQMNQRDPVGSFSASYALQGSFKQSFTMETGESETFQQSTGSIPNRFNAGKRESSGSSDEVKSLISIGRVYPSGASLNLSRSCDDDTIYNMEHEDIKHKDRNLDGLRELEKMIQLQKFKKKSTIDHRDAVMNKLSDDSSQGSFCSASPHASTSAFSLDACVDLSDENVERTKPSENEKQILQTTNILDAQLTLTEIRRPSGDA